MTRRIEILTEAVEEAEQAITWYENQRPGLGAQFAAALESALDLLATDPIPCVPVQGKAARLGVRRLILKRFPYDVVFIQSPDLGRVIAVAHHARRPGYWRRRLRT